MIFRLDYVPSDNSPSVSVAQERADAPASRVRGILDVPPEYAENAVLDIQKETLRFLCGSKAINSPAELIRILLDVGKLLDIQRFILYRIVNATEAEILLIFSMCDYESEHVEQIVPIQGNPNLEQAVSTGKPSRIPVP